MKDYTKKIVNLESTKAQYFALNSAYKIKYGIFIDGDGERKDGSEGGDLTIWLNEDDKTIEVSDFDGSYDLPEYVKDELKAYDIICDW